MESGAPAPTFALPSKEANLFRQIVRFYEQKLYKKALKNCDAILEKFPDHGETVSMKGLVLKSMDKSDEAYALAKKGLALTKFKSYVCWHVYGLLFRQDRDYDQAVKSYLNALKLDKDNLQILRDLSLLQIQIRDLPGFNETRHKLLILKPNNKNNWIGYALSHHLLKEYSQAVKVLDAYINTLTPESKEDFEFSELLLYKNMILKESGDYQKCLDDAVAINKSVLDKIWLMETRAFCYFKLGKMEDAAREYHELLKLNSENFAYLRGYHQARGVPSESLEDLSDEDAAKALAIYEELEKEFPKSHNVQRFILDIVSGDAFRQRLQKFVKPYLRKTVPSLFSDLKPLYDTKRSSRNAEKVRIIEETFLNFLDSLEKTGALPKSEGENEENATDPPTVLLWVHFFLASHFDKLENRIEALRHVNIAIERNPTIQDLYYLRARIYKRGGDVYTAAEELEKGRLLDVADRYMNTKTTKYFLRADDVDRADKVISLFTKDSETQGTSNLFDMQCMWYENECGDSHFRQKQWGRALKKYTAIDKHFKDFVEDQLDFHSYCLRKMTLRAYIDMLRFEDRIFGNKFYFRGACGAIRTYMAIHEDNIIKKEAEKKLEEEFAKLSVEEQKKATQKRKKAEKKAQEEKEEQARQAAKAAHKKGGKVDPDPFGEQLASIEKPLDEATKYLQVLQKYSDDRIETHILGAQLYMKKKKYLLVLKSLKKAAKIDAEHPDVLSGYVQLFQAVDASANTDINATVKEIIAGERKTLMQETTTLPQFVEAYISRNQGSYAKRVEAAQLLASISPESKAKAISLVTDISGTDRTLQTCVKALQSLTDGVLQDDNAAQEYRKSAGAIFPLATAFHGKKQQEQQQQQPVTENGAKQH